MPAWRPWFARSLPGSSPVIGHGDLGPWNILARESLPVAFIDWDNAGPVDAVWELAQVAWLNAQLHDDDVAELNALPDTARRLAQCAAILDGYELSSDQRVGFVDKMIEFALHSTRDEAQTYAITSDTTSPAPDGFPILWAVTWRARAAAWMLDHRSEIERSMSWRRHTSPRRISGRRSTAPLDIGPSRTLRNRIAEPPIGDTSRSSVSFGRVAGCRSRIRVQLPRAASRERAALLTTR